MSISKFIPLDKQKLDVFLPVLFKILYENMSLIAPTGNVYEEDLKIWQAKIEPAMRKEQREIILMYVEDVLAGYFQYFINVDTNSLMMEEIQIKKKFHGTGLFSEFYKWLINRLPQDIMYVEAYADKRNQKSQGILKHLGLVQSGEDLNSVFLYYKGKYTDLLRKYLE